MSREVLPAAGFPFSYDLVFAVSVTKRRRRRQQQKNPDKKQRKNPTKYSWATVQYWHFFVCFFLKGTVWGVVGREHQCAFFCVFSEKVWWGWGGPWGAGGSQHVPHVSSNPPPETKLDEEKPAPRVQSQCRGWSGAAAESWNLVT